MKGQFEHAFGIETVATKFRHLVGELVQNSTMFPVVTMRWTHERLTILDAIEQNRITDYTGIGTRGDQSHFILALDCLVDIWDELEKPTPSQEALRRKVEELKKHIGSSTSPDQE